MREQFLAGAAVVLGALRGEQVGAEWDTPSVLDGQTVGSLAGHLARGSVWVVDDYLNAEPPARVDVESAAEYFAVAVDLTPADHAAIRDRGAAIAERGHISVVDELTDRLDRLRSLLASEPPHREIAVFGGLGIRLDDYLSTRIVEQVVHLDDLARSIGVAPWANPPGADALVIACGAEIGRLRSGGPAMVRALFRDGQSALPVL